MSALEKTKTLNPNKVSKLKKKVYKIMNDCRVESGENIKLTHVSMGEPYGRFVIKDKKLKKFLKYYGEAVDYGIDFHISELPQHYGPIKCDIDLELPKEQFKKKRLYTQKMINKTVELFQDGIKKFLDVEKENLICCVFEKNKPTDKGITLKDGYHLMFVNTCCHFKMRHIIRDHVVSMAKKESEFKQFSNNIEKIFDKQVVSSVPWLMYGSKKPDASPYQLTQIIDQDSDPLPLDTYGSKGKLAKTLSLQRSKWKSENETTINQDLNPNLVTDLYNKINPIGSQNKNVSTYVSESKEEDIRKARHLVNLLSPERAENYDDWIRIGWILHNIDKSLLPVWIDFSKKCSSKYKPGECERRWKKMRGHGLSIRSLMSYAKEDNYIQYQGFMQGEFNNVLQRSLNCSTYFIAKALYVKYYDKFVCSSLKDKKWYEFRGHRWVKADEGYTLFSKISEEFADQYSEMAAEYNTKATQVTGYEKEELQKKAQKIQSVITKLLDNRFKKSIMEECRVLFYDEKFIEKLDENYHLLSFNNGVYDLEKEEFRNGRPEDYVSLCTNIDYEPWDDNHPYANNIIEYFKAIQPNENVRNYLITGLSTCLSGENKEEKLRICTGDGSNGKSVLFDLMKEGLGDYFISCPITIMTKKRNASNAASPELARIKGKRIGVLQEPESHERLNVGIMKELTGNDSFMARGLFQEPFEIKPQIKFWLTCNVLPIVPSRDGGTWRRIVALDFGSKFVEKPEKPNEFKIDKTLKSKLPEWAPVFMGFLINNYIKTYKVKGLIEPEEVKYSTNSYKMDNDHFFEFLNERLEVVDDKKAVISKRTMWQEFKAWFKDTHEGKKLPLLTELNRFLTKSIGDATGKGWTNVVFRNEEGDLSEDDDDDLDK